MCYIGPREGIKDTHRKEDPDSRKNDARGGEKLSHKYERK
jgi:hypothetical protein